MKIRKLTVYKPFIQPIKKVSEMKDTKNDKQPNQQFNLKKKKDFHTILDEIIKERN